MIKMISGWSNPGGSTVAFINLCNAFNKHGIICTFYGPHEWHLGKCRGHLAQHFRPYPSDIIIAHFQSDFPMRPNCKKFILSCHEKDIYPLKEKNYKVYDSIHFVSEQQRDWHGIEHPNFVLPNLIDDTLVPNKTGIKNVAGVIGSIDENKQTHISIQRALDDGMTRVLLYGNITDAIYYNNHVKPFLNKYKNVKHVGHCDNKQEMYDSVSDVYLSSLSETWGFIPKECEKTGRIFHGTDATKNNFNIELSNEEIVAEWFKQLEIDVNGEN